MHTPPLILYVEDNDDNVAMLKLRLELEGYAVVVAMDGAAGVRLARDEQPDLVLMDLDLPGIDGLEATRRLRADAATRGIPVIALSAHVLPEQQAAAREAGCDDYEPKPIDFTRLLGKLRTLMEAR